MNQFVFTSRERLVFGGAILLGVLCLVLTFFVDDALHTRFWTNYLHNTVFFLGIGFVALFVLAAFVTAYAGWYVVMKRIWEAYSLWLLPGIFLMGVVIVGVVTHGHHLYHWADHTAVEVDPILEHKSSFLNVGWYSIGTILVVGAWIFFATQLRKISLAEDADGTRDFNYHRRYKRMAAWFLPIGAFTSAGMIWQWIMSIDAHWYSTMFAWYTTASWFVSMIALTIMMIIYLKGRGYYDTITNEHLHDLGKYLFAFSVFWTYLWFSQYMLIWYANIGEETVYFRERLTNYRLMFYANLVINFVLPLFVLIRNDNKRKYGVMFFASLFLFLGHWFDFFLMIKPGALITAQEALMHAAGHAGEAAGHGAEVGGHLEATVEGIQPQGYIAGFTIPGLLELGTMIGFLGGFLYFVFSRLEKAPLSPLNDPYFQESTHHHV